MPLKIFEPYRKDKDAWDWKFIMFVTGLFPIPNLEVLIGLLVLGVFVAMAFALMFIAYLFATYTWHVYKEHATGTSQSARLLQGALAGFVLIWALSFTLYDDAVVNWAVFINLLAFSWLVFALTVVGVDTYEERRAAQRQVRQLPNPTPAIKDVLNWNASTKQQKKP